MDPNKKPRSYYVDYSKKRFNNRPPRGNNNKSGDGSRFKSTPDLSFGNRGFLITAFDEVKCYLEMRGVLEEYFDLLYGKSNRGSNETTTANDTSLEEQKDLDEPSIEDELEEELKQLRVRRPFKQVKTHCRNSLFINIVDKFNYVDPVPIVYRFFDDIASKGELRTSNTFKVLPILDTFRGSKSCAQTSISNLIKTRFSLDDTKNYFIEFQSRGNYKLNPDDKKEIIEGLAETISELKPSWKVSRDSADYFIIVIAFRQVCCISIVEQYFERKKYNLVEFCKGPTEDAVEDSVDNELKEGYQKEINTD